MNPELIAAVKERLALGHTEEMIKEELRQVGYEEQVIEQVFHTVQLPTVPQPQTSSSGEVVLPDAGTLFKHGWDFAIRYKALALILVIPLLITSLLQFASIEMPFFATGSGTLIAGVGGLIGMIIYFFLMVATYRIVALDDGSRIVPLQEGWQWATNHFGGFLWVSILTMLVVMGGYVLFIIPGIILIFLLYLAPYVYAQEGLRGMSALLRSRELVRGHLWALTRRLLLVFLMLVGIFIGIAIILDLLGVGFASYEKTGLSTSIIQPFLSAFFTLILLHVNMDLYRGLAHVKPATATVGTEGRGKYVALAWLGLLLPVLGVLLVVVLSSLNVARDAGSTAALLSNMNMTRVQAEIYHSETDSYLGVCAELPAFITNGGEVITCNDAEEGWAMEVESDNGEVYCVDDMTTPAEGNLSTENGVTCAGESEFIDLNAKERAVELRQEFEDVNLDETSVYEEEWIE